MIVTFASWGSLLRSPCMSCETSDTDRGCGVSAVAVGDVGAVLYIWLPRLSARSRLESCNQSALPMYSFEVVLTLIASPSLTNNGTCSVSPVSVVAGFVAPL